MKAWLLRLGYAAVCAFFMSCLGERVNDIDAGETEREPDAGELANAPNFTYFTLRKDFRRCVSPLCGGFFVKRVNRVFTVCADGKRRPECYVAELDLGALGLDPDQAAAITGSPQEFLLRGKIQPKVFPRFGNLGVFAAREAWRGHAGVVPTGTFFRATNNGLVCVTFPCLSFDAGRLNSLLPPIKVAGVDLEGIVPDVSDGNQQLNEPEGLLVAAVSTIVSGPAGRARALDASEYYIPFRSAPRVCGTIAGLGCEKGEFCDFGLGQCKISDAAGVCRPIPLFCIEVIDPVCGCDGVTYNNSCEADRAGAQIDRAGACGP